MFYQIAGYLSGLAIAFSFIPYIRDIFRGTTKPERISWFIWSILGFISTFSLLAKGASFSLILPGVQALGDLTVFVLAIKYGLGGFAKRDIVALAAATVGLLLWYFFQEPALALFMAILVDGSGAVLTIMKSYEKPETETLSTWILTCLGGLFGIFAVGSFDWILLSFPVYVFAVTVLIIGAILLGRRGRV